MALPMAALACGGGFSEEPSDGSTGDEGDASNIIVVDGGHKDSTTPVDDGGSHEALGSRLSLVDSRSVPSTMPELCPFC